MLRVFFFGLYLSLQMPGIAGGDSGDLVTAAVVKGISHPPGYPLYTLLGWLLTRLPLGLPAAFTIGWLSPVPAAFAVSLRHREISISRSQLRKLESTPTT